MNITKIRKFCRIFRIVLGSILIIIGFMIGNSWFYLGIMPLIAGIVNFCPLCKITRQCNIM